MDIIELLLISFSLSMDAFTVAMCKGVSSKTKKYKKAIIVGLYFGIFQALMPLIGYVLSNNFNHLIINLGNYIVLFLLLIIGVNMILESRRNKNIDEDISFKSMLVLSLATSIDAFAVGITFAFSSTNIIMAILIIGVMTFALSVLAVKIGGKLGCKYEQKAELFGGLILILLALKAFIENI